MRYISGLHEGETIRNVYLCKGKRSAETRNGKPYDNLILQDKTGTLDGKVWDPNSQGISEYSEKKKEIFLLQGNKSAYIEQLWQLVLEHEAGDLDLYRELKRQYTEDEWVIKREEVFKKLPAYAHVERLYKEEKLYDRLLAYVLNSPGLYSLQEYEKVLKKEYPEQILGKYKDEVNKMAIHTSDRKHYAHLVSLLRKMQQMKGGVKLVEQIVSEWKLKYKNRPAMMDELRKL